MLTCLWSFGQYKCIIVFSFLNLHGCTAILLIHFFAAMFRYSRSKQVIFFFFKNNFMIKVYYEILMMTNIWVVVSANVFDMKNIGVSTPTLQEWSESKAWSVWTMQLFAPCAVQFQDSKVLMSFGKLLNCKVH